MVNVDYFSYFYLFCEYNVSYDDYTLITGRTEQTSTKEENRMGKTDHRNSL